MTRRVISEQDLYPVPTSSTQPVHSEPSTPWPTAIPNPIAAPSTVGETTGRRSWLIVGGIMLTVAMGLAGFFGGRLSRPSDATIKERVQAAEQRVVGEQQRILSAELAKQRRELDRQRQSAVAKASATARKAGRAAGLAEGQSVGRASGVTEGREVGRSEGFEDGTCYTPTVPRQYIC